MAADHEKRMFEIMDYIEKEYDVGHHWQKKEAYAVGEREGYVLNSDEVTYARLLYSLVERENNVDISFVNGVKEEYIFERTPEWESETVFIDRDDKTLKQFVYRRETTNISTGLRTISLSPRDKDGRFVAIVGNGQFANDRQKPNTLYKLYFDHRNDLKVEPLMVEDITETLGIPYVHYDKRT